jgi:alkylmercury lyase
VRTAVVELEAAGRIQVAENGTIVGSAGLSVVPSRHRLRIVDRWFWTWCAWDAVGILGALRAPGAISSHDPRSGAAIELTFTGGTAELSQAAIFRAHDNGLYASIRDEYCPLTNLFEDTASASAWSHENTVHGDVLSVAEAAVEAAAEWNSLVAGVTLP